MGFEEAVKIKMGETLAQRIEVAEGTLKRLTESKRQCIDRTAVSELDLLILRKTAIGPGNPDRLAKESVLHTKIREAKDQYTKMEREAEAADRDLRTHQEIKSDLKKGALQLIA